MFKLKSIIYPICAVVLLVVTIVALSGWHVALVNWRHDGKLLTTSIAQTGEALRIGDERGVMIDDLIELTDILFAIIYKGNEETSSKYLFVLSGQSNMERLDVNSSFLAAVVGKYGAEALVVKEAKGGMQISMWVQGQNGILYDSLLKKIRSRIKGAEPKVIAFCWMQGESDAMLGSFLKYEENLKTLISQLKEDFPFTQFVFVIGRLSDYGMGHDGWEVVRKAQEDVCESIPNCTLVNTDDLNGKTNDLHLTLSGYKVLGERFVQEAIKLIEGIEQA